MSEWNLLLRTQRVTVHNLRVMHGWTVPLGMRRHTSWTMSSMSDVSRGLHFGWLQWNLARRVYTLPRCYLPAWRRLRRLSKEHVSSHGKGTKKSANFFSLPTFGGVSPRFNSPAHHPQYVSHRPARHLACHTRTAGSDNMSSPTQRPTLIACAATAALASAIPRLTTSGSVWVSPFAPPQQKSWQLPPSPRIATAASAYRTSHFWTQSQGRASP